jgi:hypothetical protein
LHSLWLRLVISRWRDRKRSPRSHCRSCPLYWRA